MAGPAAVPGPRNNRPWCLRGRSLTLDRPRVLGILNVTPDSFSDGGLYLAPDAAIEHGSRLLAEGADILDIGGESTRPGGAVPVDAAEELRRVMPVVEGLRRRHPEALLSVDTVKASVAAAALDAGADIINDVSAFRLDPGMAGVCATAGAGVILMHSRGGVHEMASYERATYGEDVAGEVIAELEDAVARALRGGVMGAAILLDPGIGFSKRSADSIAVLRALPRLAALGYPIAVGASRKRVVGDLTGVAAPEARLYGTVGVHVAALVLGARVFRVHDVAAARQSLDAAWAILGATP